MTRFFSLSLLSLLLISQAPAFVVSQGQPAADLTGLWKQQLEGGGVSVFELTPKDKHTYAAQEYGLGGVTGTAHLEDGHLVIRFVNDGDKCHYNWHLKGVSGHGKFVRTGQDGGEKEVVKSSVRFIGR